MAVSSGKFRPSTCLIQARAMQFEQLGSSYVLVLGLEALLAVILGTVLFGEQLSGRGAAGITVIVTEILLIRST